VHTICKALITWTFCLVVSIAAARGQEWYGYRHDVQRTGVQPFASPLSDPTEIQKLHVVWQFPSAPNGSPLVGHFRASPIVVNGIVFIGSDAGFFYALDAATGALKWQYPPQGSPLTGSCGAFGAYGIQQSAAYATIGGRDAVIFGAPDPSAPGGLGSAALFAMDFSGHLIWKSGPINDPIALVNGCTPARVNRVVSLAEKHEEIRNSAPLVLGNKVYVGIHDAGDNPIQNGKAVAVDLNTGQIDNDFHFTATSARGGGVWNALATDGAGVYFTTGNTRCDLAGCQSPEPNPNHGLSMIRVDKDTGTIIWSFQPVPYVLDDDPDWNAGATVMSTSCGEQIVSVQKDGWSYALDAASGSCNWQFPPVSPPIADSNSPRCKWTGYSKFDPTGPRIHGGDGYRMPGAAWNDVLISITGGEALVADGLSAGYGRLHALNACATTEQDRVRWIADIGGLPTTSLGSGENSLGAPTVTGGIVFVPTGAGHLVVLVDPLVDPTPNGLFRCSNVAYLNPSDCTGNGYAIVQIPRVLADIPLGGTGHTKMLRQEAALAEGRVFVGTADDDNPGGHVYMLDTTTVSVPPPCEPCCAGNDTQCIKDCGQEDGSCRTLCGRQLYTCLNNCGRGIACVPGRP
jgi:outer membrane protein assembly factor BamB